MTEADWQEYRESQQGIGGSEIATILGVNPFKSKFTLWLEKTGQKPREKIENEAVEWGNLLEPVVRDKFRRTTGFKVVKNNFVLQSDVFDFAVANLDGEVIDPNLKGRGILEIKTTHERNKKQWEDGVPIYYMAQVQWYMMVTGYEYSYIAVLIGGNHYKHYLVERDEYTIEMLLRGALEFMEFVKKKIPPPIGGSKDETEWLAKAFPEAIEEEMRIPPSIEELAMEYNELQYEIKQKHLRSEEIKNQIKLEAKEFKTLRGSAVRISLPTINKTLFDSKKFANEQPALYQQYKTKVSSYRGFDVSLLGD